MYTLVCTGDIKENLEDELVQEALRKVILYKLLYVYNSLIIRAHTCNAGTGLASVCQRD